jgi:phosphatidylinositol alpha-1,6-mannosyltransferase
MKTLLFTLEYPPFRGGVANYYGNIEKYWSRHAAEDLGIAEDDPDAQLRVLHNNDGALLSGWLWPKWLPAFRLLKSAVERQGIEHILVGHILPLGTVAYRYSRKSKLPYSVMLHGMDLALAMKPGRKQMLAKMVLRNAANIICSNAFTAEIAKKFVGEGSAAKVHVVHPGVELDEVADPDICAQVRSQYQLDNKIVLFSVGRLVGRKGFEHVIRAMPKVTEVLPDVHYFFAGDGPEKVRLLELAMQTKNVTYLEKFSQEQKLAWFELCDIFIMPSYSEGADFEGFGIVFLEANIAGKPVIGGRSGGVPEAIDDGISGLLVEPKNIDQIASAIIKLGQNPGLRQQLGRQAKARAREWFNWPRQIGHLYKILNAKS